MASNQTRHTQKCLRFCMLWILHAHFVCIESVLASSEADRSGGSASLNTKAKASVSSREHRLFPKLSTIYHIHHTLANITYYVDSNDFERSGVTLI